MQTIDKAAIFHFNVDQYFLMIKTGIIRDGAPYELIDGILVLKDRAALGGKAMSIGSGHVISVGRIAKLDDELLKLGCHMRHQSPVVLTEWHAPEPDGAIVKGMDLDYEDGPPSAAEIFSIMEVSESSLAFDQGQKLGLYAEANIPQYVILNLVARQVESYELPDPLGKVYKKTAIYKSGDLIPFFIGRRKRFSVPVDFLIPPRKAERSK